jgi:uncharacterized protein (DUF2164 family)
VISEIKHYFAKERDEEPGDLAAGRVLDFITEKLVPVFTTSAWTIRTGI